MMERLLILRAQARGCTVEAFVNDIPVGRTGEGTGALCLPVHEFVVEGENEVRLVVEPGPPGVARERVPRASQGDASATLRLLLPRIGRVGSEDQARTLGELAWSARDGEVFEAPHALCGRVVLPVAFPRWRWLDVPPVDDVAAQRGTAAAFVHRIAADMMRGDFQSLLAGSRVRLEELALAYQRPAAELAARLAGRLRELHAARQLRLLVPAEGELLLRPCAGGRLLECLDPSGAAALHTAPAAAPAFAWPLRLAFVNGRCHAFR